MTTAPAGLPVSTSPASTAINDERLAWLALALTPQLGPRRILRAVEQVGAAARILNLRLTELEGLRFPAESAQFLADGRSLDLAGKEQAALTSLGARFLCHADEAYPARLREIFDAPPVLWLRGEAAILQQPALAVVGTRHPTPYGSAMAEMLARDLAQRGLIILSGMARGVDTSAHKGALAAGKPNIAIWGTGIDVVYPKENQSLAEKILSTGGAILSEFPLGTFPAPPNFPRRNRILSGISIGVLVVEAAEYSGTRITARCALEQNRDVFAVPGNVTNKNAWGPNTLIKQGAKLTATWEDVWEDLPSQVRLELESLLSEKAGLASNDAPAASLFREEPLPPHEARLLSILRPDEALQIDEIMEKLEAELSSSEVFTALFELELAGRVRQLPGKNYVRCL
ncbi:DNA-processing protein DprA [Silvibacterium dinghuense]|uniref:DNA-protecting protein DprA n=1 Tax=Silvibacterium dinghuense TaxID=1560006 RepID=A0A4Q1SBR1_9BACT|nr:DNA-processing protein DprA [Silvibacterium dinghuense]RXS94459.1 DNA-protecting protein DprA [Silvibacterium dinghuense]GGH15960.1 DNA polymerase [Silvibacterium dinghuense]